ncbi:MAG: hypothetical protein AAF682_32645 [Planctomycetota bacterium]
MRFFLSALAASTAGLIAALPLSAQDAPAEGYGLTTLDVAPPVLPVGPYGGPVFGSARTMSNGDVVTFDGLTVERVAADGTPIATLGTFPAATFPGCFAIDPTDTVAVIGAGSFGGEVFVVNLDGSGMSLLANITFNFDAVFDGPNSVLISANTSASFSDNDILRVDVPGGTINNVAFVGGPSGPLALDPAGNLYYGLQADPVAVLQWSAADLAGGSLLTEANAVTIADGFLGASSLAFDPVGGELYLAENDFAFFSGSNRILRVGTSAATSTVVVDGTTLFNNLSSLEFVGGTDGALFEPFQPDFGGTLRYSAVDFVSSTARIEAQPARPAAALSGAGTAGPGTVDFTVTGGPDGGSVLVFFGPTSAWTLPEAAFLFGGPPLFTGFDLNAIELTDLVVPLDELGTGAVSAYNPGGLKGSLTIQGLVLDSTTSTVSTTNGVDL